MLIRVKGADSGIEDYLENGQKQGRENSRDELDERIILDGDLDSIRAVNESLDNNGEKYLHVTLAFKEDELSREVLEAITQDFKAFAFSAYESDEYAFYAEAHIPRIKSYVNSQNGEFIERKPHIHIVIPKTNLLSGGYLSPLGRIEQQTAFLEAFQELTNAKYGLASPKENRRTGFNLESEIVSRYKGDEFIGREVFTGHHKELKTKILTDILKRNIGNQDDLMALLSEYGSVRIRNEGRANEYLNVKPDPAGKGVNLKEYVFTPAFLGLSAEQKRQELSKVASAQYETAGPARPTPEEYQAILKDWHERRAKEIKYLNSGNKKQYAEYKSASPDKKAAILVERENRFYAKHRKTDYDLEDRDPERTLERIRENLGTVDRHIESASRIAGDLDRAGGNRTRRRIGRALRAAVQRLTGHQGRAVEGRETAHELGGTREADNVTGQLKYDHREQKANARSAELSEFQEIRRHLDASRLLNALSHSHGVIPEKYPISKGKDGGDRIQAGTRNLNVSDFLTKELNLPWSEAAKILRETYREQTRRESPGMGRQRPGQRLWEQFRLSRQNRSLRNKEQWEAQRKSETTQKEAIRKVFYAKRGGILGNRSLSQAERKARISIARMERIEQERVLRERIRKQRDDLKASQRRPLKDEYAEWLTLKAQEGDVYALVELRRMQRKEKERTDDHEIHSGSVQENREDTPFITGNRLSYQVHRDGAVTYRRGGNAVVRDEGRFVKVLQTDDGNIETGLRLARAKFGRKLDIRGSDVFKAAVARVAAERGLYVEFIDPRLNAILAARRAELQQARAQTRPGMPDSQAPRPQPQGRKETTGPTMPTIESVAPEIQRGQYSGRVVQVDANFVYQDHGREIIRHDRERFASAPVPGDCLRITYRDDQMKAERVPEKTRTRDNDRGR
jgi:hypothetical protein